MSREKNPMAPRNPLVFLVTEMPLVRTSAGIRPSAWLTRFCTSIAARSAFRPISNVTVMLENPVLVLEERMYCIPSTPLMTCSSGVVTALSTACALAPV